MSREDASGTPPPPLTGRSDREAIREGGNRSAHNIVADLQRQRARSLRTDMTDAERRRWSRLRAHRLHGLSFRRQVPIGRFIVDFACHDRELVVEVDGGQHAESTRDIERDQRLASKGYRVLHFWNSDVLANLEGVLETILIVIENTPLPGPPPQGGREQDLAS